MARKPENGRHEASSEHIASWMAQRDELVGRMTRDGSWRPEFGPLLHEFAEALRMAAKLRGAAEEELFVKSARSGRSYLHPGIAAADLEVRRAALLLSRVDSMARSRAAKAVEPEDKPDGWAVLDAMTVYSDDPAEDARIRRERADRLRAASSKGRR
jgi:hypothetical protein